MRRYRFLRRLLDWRIPAEHRDFVVGDLDERFRAIAESRGSREATRWYCRQTIRALVTRWPRPLYSRQFADHRKETMSSDLIRNLSSAFHSLRSAPGFALTVIATLGLCIGANTTVFSWVNRVLLSPLPGVEGTLLELREVTQSGTTSLSYPDYLDYRDRATTIDLAGHEETPIHLSVNGETHRLWAELVTGNYFELLGLSPATGRLLQPADTVVAGSPAVLVISSSLWHRLFAAAPDVAGRVVRINETPFTIIGVAPQGFLGSVVGLELDAFLPITMQPAVMPGSQRLQHRGQHWFDGLARLRPDRRIDEARAELQQIFEAVRLENGGITEVAPDLRTIANSDNGGVALLRPVVLALMTVVAVILLIGCANVANLLLIRSTARRREIAIRLSLGATRRQLVTQLMMENLLLAAAGGVAGLGVAYGGSGLLAAFAPPSDLPVSLDAAIDSRVLMFTIGASLAATILFGLLPSVRLGNAAASDAFKQGVGSGQRSRLRSGLVIVQVALSLALVVTAGLCVRSFANIRSFDPGFDRDRMLLASIDLFPSGYDPTRGRDFYRRLFDVLRNIPGVRAYTQARHVPLALTGLSSSSIDVEGYTPRPGERPQPNLTPVGPDYAGVMGMALLAGRDILRSDDVGQPAVALINETMATRFWDGREAVGGRFRFGSNSPWITVVGVTRDIKWRDVRERPRPFVFLPVLQSFAPATTLHIRTDGDPMALSAQVRQAVHSIDPSVPVFAFRTLEGHLGAASFQQRLAGTLLVVFGGLALALAALGLYGVLEFTVRMRTREFGVRAALGAAPWRLRRAVMKQGLILVASGGIGGLLLSVGLAGLLSTLLFGVQPADPVTIAVATGLLGVVALMACLLPARRATRVDPVVCLRQE